MMEERTPARSKVFDWLEDSIQKGELRPGGVVPSERTLSARLGIARNTAARALSEAEKLGMLVRRSPTGRKRYVVDNGSSERPMVLPALTSPTILVISDLNPFHPAGEQVPRWSDRYISLDLLSLLTAAGHHVMVVNNETLAGRDLEKLFMGCPSGVILTTTISENPTATRALEICHRKKIPVVVYGNNPMLRTCDRVHADHKEGARMLTRWLLAHGCRRIVPFFPNDTQVYWAKRRYEGYAESMADAGEKPFPCISYKCVDVDFLPPEQEFQVYRGLVLSKLIPLVREGVDALMCLTDHTARIVISALRILGFEPNRDILVTGYDNIPDDPKYEPLEAEGPIVTIDKHNERTAAELAHLLLDRLAGRLPPEPQRRTHVQELIARVPEDFVFSPVLRHV
ncbi:MAG: GntR family transcriptional regulator [Kiritimatiellia bacterium]